MATLDAIIIGAGFSGLYQLYTLRDQLNLNCHLFEAADEVGGTWHWNQYPGARCDTESQAYCYYFNKKIYNEWNWTERYPSQQEVKDYLKFVAKKLNLFRSISFSSNVKEMKYFDKTNKWKIQLDRGNTFDARFVIMATGCLSSENLPIIANQEKFKGKILHTGKWPKENIKFNDLDVGVVGTGSTGIQVIPEIAKTVKSLTVFQRTPNYSIPARNQKLNLKELNLHKNNFEYLKNVSINNRHGHPWKHSTTPIHQVGSVKDSMVLNKAWEHGGLSFRDSFSNINYDECANSVVSNFIINKIQETVNDPVTANELSDFDYPFGAKRPALDTHYFETFNQDNVKLINIQKTPIDSFNHNGVLVNSIHYPLDIVVFATGFDAITGSLLKINIIGKKGKNLKSEWKKEPINLLGLQIPNFPNLFTITGPGSPSVLTNMPRAIEQHVDWVTMCISKLINMKKNKIEASHSAALAWLDEVKLESERTMFLKTSNSWYLGTNVKGKPKGFIPYSGGLDKYTNICNAIAQNGYKGFIIS